MENFQPLFARSLAGPPVHGQTQQFIDGLNQVAKHLGRTVPRFFHGRVLIVNYSPCRGKGSGYKSQLTGLNKITIRVNHSALGFDKAGYPVKMVAEARAPNDSSPTTRGLRLQLTYLHDRASLPPRYLNPRDRFAPFHDCSIAIFRLFFSFLFFFSFSFRRTRQRPLYTAPRV